METSTTLTTAAAVSDAGYKFIGMGLATLGMIGAAIGAGIAFAALIGAVARNPSVESRITKYAFIGAAFAEFMGLLAFVVAIMIMIK